MINNPNYPFNTIQDAVLSNQVIFLRVDFNVPIIDGKIIDYSRVDECIKTIDFLVKSGAKVVIGTHIGRPCGKSIPSMSTKILHPYLQKVLRCKVDWAQECIGSLVQTKLSALNYGEVLLLENLRFHKEEEECDFDFAFQLMSGMTMYVNECFSCSHRAHSSIVPASMFVRSLAGFNLQKEYSFLSSVKNSGFKKKKMAIIGGSKISTKIHVLRELTESVSTILVGGGMMNTFLKASGKNVGKSLVEESYLEKAIEIINIAAYNDCEILLPNSVVVSEDIHSKPRVIDSSKVNDEDIIFDIDPSYIHSLNNKISEMDLLLWNGPLGMFEVDQFSFGSIALMNEIAKNKKATKIVGGGESLALVSKFKKNDDFSFVSTAGGAFLDYIGGKILPGLKSLESLRFNF